jgi:hypothetical protein
VVNSTPRAALPPGKLHNTDIIGLCLILEEFLTAVKVKLSLEQAMKAQRGGVEV